MAEQSVTLQPEESKAVSFEATPQEARTYQVSVNGLTGSFVASEAPVPGDPKLISFDYPEQIVCGHEFWAGQTVFLPYIEGTLYTVTLSARTKESTGERMQRANYLAADIYDKLEQVGLHPEEDYIRLAESGYYTHYGVGLESYTEPAILEPTPYGIYPVLSSSSAYRVWIRYMNGSPKKAIQKIATLWVEEVGTVEIVVPVGDWVWPTGHNDPYDSWSMEWRAYDGDLDTHTNSGNDLNEWSGFLEFTFDPPIMSDKARFNADFLPGLNDEIDLDVHRDGVWIDVYQGSFASRTWIETSFPQGSVDKARIRMRHTTKPGFAVEWLYEFQLFCVEVA